MRLSAELFHQISRSFGEAPQRGPEASNERGEARIGLVGRATIIPCPQRCGRRPVSVAVRDLSSSGLGVIHTQRLDPGEQFILRMPSGTRGATATAVLCTVVHCQPLALGVYALGARFADVIESAATSAPGSTAPKCPPTMHVGSLAEAFRDQALGGLSAEEAEQLREVEERLSRLQEQ
jgi:PilZ domain